MSVAGSFDQPECSGRSRVDELKAPDKPFEISKRAVWEAWEKVKANGGAAGVDGQTITEFEKDLQGNLFKIWNRMSSGRTSHRRCARWRSRRRTVVAPGCSGCRPWPTGSRRRS